jgi:NAD-dependent DNA ligase
VKKLQQHPIKSWQEYFSNDLYCEMINDAHLMLGEKEINELYDDFKNSRNNELKKLIFRLIIIN